MSPKPSDDIGHDSGAYVLHALSAEERARFESALTDSEAACAEVTELADTAVELGLSIAPVEPPAALRGRILDRLATTPQLAAVEAPVEAPVGGAVAARPGSARPESAEERARRRWTLRPVSTLLAAAAVLGLLFGGGIAVNAVVQAQQASATASEVSRIQAAPDSRHATVRVSTGGTATLIWSAELKRSAIVVRGLGALPGGKTYELWYLDKAGATPAGTFDANGSTQSVVLAGAMKAGDSVGVTVEPAGGSQTPTTAPIAVVETA